MLASYKANRMFQAVLIEKRVKYVSDSQPRDARARDCESVFFYGNEDFSREIAHWSANSLSLLLSKLHDWTRGISKH